MSKKELIIEVLKVIAAIIAATITALTVTSCMGLKIKGNTEYEYHRDKMKVEIPITEEK